MTEYKRAFVDTAPIIYYLENSSLYIDSQIAEQGAKIRSQYKNFKTMDALQIATAVIIGRK